MQTRGKAICSVSILQEAIIITMPDDKFNSVNTGFHPADASSEVFPTFHNAQGTTAKPVPMMRIANPGTADPPGFSADNGSAGIKRLL